MLHGGTSTVVRNGSLAHDSTCQSDPCKAESQSAFGTKRPEPVVDRWKLYIKPESELRSRFLLVFAALIAKSEK
jgi:hypothetical protein